MKKINIIYIFVAIFIINLPLFSQEPHTGSQETEKSVLIYLHSPVAGYNSLNGLIFDFLPLGIEIPMNHFIGLRAETGLIYYNATLQYFNINLFLQFYLFPESGTPYGGFYVAPGISSAVNFSNQN
ncbi:MAG: hypothetical protein ABUK01_15710 [Leptospirales bacterium]